MSYLPYPSYTSYTSNQSYTSTIDSLSYLLLALDDIPSRDDSSKSVTLPLREYVPSRDHSSSISKTLFSTKNRLFSAVLSSSSTQSCFSLKNNQIRLVQLSKVRIGSIAQKYKLSMYRLLFIGIRYCLALSHHFKQHLLKQYIVRSRCYVQQFFL